MDTIKLYEPMMKSNFYEIEPPKHLFYLIEKTLRTILKNM